MDTAKLLRQCRETLESRYGSRLAAVLVYGSEARGESDAGSDIDLLVVLRGDFDFFDELRVVVDTLYPLQLETNRHISAKPASEEDLNAGRIQFYRNVLREGVPV